ncbi:hypothetical protein DL95DRAFT_482309 [Leptodontidium sp. 2 PMI_412]|nr:hypothetical protein DL95DRAFT_482309 [Leptodontidium sp. 2 PMI_412]
MKEVGYCKQAANMVSPASPRTDDSYAVTPASNSTSKKDWRPDSPVRSHPVEPAQDDTMVRDQPSRHVDYLCHDWKVEDIWSSRKHIVSERKAYCNSARLENALWRTWTKSQYRLKTVLPETMDWLKDCDVTWLYGPLQSSSDKLSMTPTSLAGVGISKLNSSSNKKSILKKRSVLDTMLQLSLSSSSLPNPAATAVQTQRTNTILPPRKSDTSSMGRAASSYVTFPFSLRPLRRDDGNEFPSVTSSGEQSLVMDERKHIHFNDKVEQWIAVDIVDGDDDEDGIESYAIYDDEDSSSDDEFLMMKRSSRWKQLKCPSD